MKLHLLTIVLTAFVALPVATQQKQPAPGDPKREVHMYDVRDLIQPQGSGDKITAVNREEIAAKNIKMLAGFVKTFIQPPLEKGEDVKSLGGGSLVALARPNQQAWVQRFLAQNREKKPYLLSVQASFVHMGDKTFEKQLRPLLKKDSRAIIDDTEKSGAFMAGLLRKEDVTLISAPRFLALPLKHASLWVGSKITYVSDYEIKKIDSPKGYVADPVVQEAHDGILFEGTGAFVDESFIGLDFKLLIAELHKPIDTETLAERKKNVPAAIRKLNLKVSLPSTTRTTLKSKALVPNRGWAVFSLGRRHKKHWILILKVEEIAEGK
ncbi:MAG: hypothetical protein ACYTGW_03320 [Planctomycetota bacterium]|jgi:hypothetical protein